MPQTAAELLEAARQLPSEERDWLLQSLQEEEFAAWQKKAGVPEPGYNEWFAKQVQEALDDNRPGIPHEQVMRDARSAIRRAAKVKQSA